MSATTTATGASPLTLGHAVPVATGNSRLVYRHPADAGLLIKLLRPEKAAWFRQRRFRWYQKRRRYRELGSFLQEIGEQLVARVQQGGLVPHLQEVVGLTETDLGPGLVVRALHARDGRYAPTLASVVRSGGFDAQAEQALERFFEWLLRSRIVVSDLNWGNLLYAWDEVLGASRFVLVDGMGEAAAFPLRSLVDWINRASKRRKIAALRTRIAAERTAVSCVAVRAGA